MTGQDPQGTAKVERGDLVRLVGIMGTGKALGEVRSVSGRGVLVTVCSTGNREYWHPSDVRRVRRAARG